MAQGEAREGQGVARECLSLLSGKSVSVCRVHVMPKKYNK